MIIYEECTGCGSRTTDAELKELQKTHPNLRSCCPDRKMVKRTTNGHVLFTFRDFSSQDAQDNGPLYRNVVDGGLAVCKVCGDFEAGLDNPCTGRPKTGEIATSEGARYA